jgi:hypothetical protein
MPSKAEKQRRKQIHRELARKEYETFINSLPIDKSIIIDLFDFLDTELGERDCNHDYQITKDFLKQKGIDNDSLFEWFQDNGGYCDCEILYNIEEKFEE